MKIENLVFEGGGVLGFAYVGVVKALEERQVLKKCTGFAGSSAGAITAALLACGATSKDLESALQSLDATELFDSSCFTLANLYRLWNAGGWTRGAKLEQWVGKLLGILCRGNQAITFQQVYDLFGKKLVLTGTCLETRKTEYFSRENCPRMSVALAVRISAGYPCVYPMIEHLNYHWWDGGIGDNYPVHVFDQQCDDVKCDKNSKNRIPNMKTIGFKLVSEMSGHKGIPKAPLVIDNVQDAVMSVGSMIFDLSRLVHVHEIDWKRTVLIDVGTISSMNFSISNAEKKFLVDNGYMATLDFIDDFAAASAAVAVVQNDADVDADSNSDASRAKDFADSSSLVEKTNSRVESSDVDSLQ